MSVECDKLAIQMLNEQERKEEMDRLSSELYSVTNQIKDLKSEYDAYQQDGQYDEMEETMSEICSLKEDQENLKSSLSEFKQTRFY